LKGIVIYLQQHDSNQIKTSTNQSINHC